MLVSGHQSSPRSAAPPITSLRFLVASARKTTQPDAASLIPAKGTGTCACICASPKQSLSLRRGTRELNSRRAAVQQPLSSQRYTSQRRTKPGRCCKHLAAPHAVFPIPRQHVPHCPFVPTQSGGPSGRQSFSQAVREGHWCLQTETNRAAQLNAIPGNTDFKPTAGADGPLHGLSPSIMLLTRPRATLHFSVLLFLRLVGPTGCKQTPFHSLFLTNFRDLSTVTN
jgi:hypothetical protein